MTTVSRRSFLEMTAAGAALAANTSVHAADARMADLKSLTTNAQPITEQEHAARIAKVQGLMQQRKIAALLVEAGPSLQYFTGIRWFRSERTTAALIPAAGKVVVITPFFEEPSVREWLKIPAEVRPWEEDESPFDLIVGALRDHAPAKGSMAVESTTRFFIVDRVGQALRGGRAIVSGDALVRPCRIVKSTAELALMQTANEITLAALKYVHARVETGMSGPDIM